MTFRAVNKTWIEPIAQGVMIFGIIALCQPWIEWLHRWSVAISLVGLVTFLVSIHIPPPDAEDDDDSDSDSDIQEDDEAGSVTVTPRW